VAARLRGYGDTGVTDLMAAVLGLADGADDRERNRQRTLALLASL